ncbi:hypothetical protein GCM10009641_59100 [Mycobacterium cookii]|uniref:Uncharacterized protein n=1 Tax=Nocardioides furvisabuli TaxID=375542 RepID=A0ABN2XAR7_9ACTN|nr:hypothetical protein [Nocardioides furvisabuli]
MKIDTHTPHVEPAWAEAFVVELRLRGVDGRRIGAALAEVEAHCAESGESAHEAFGDPTAYAVELAPDGTVSLDWRGELVPAALGLGGMMLTLGAVGASRSGTQVELTTGLVLVVALAVLGTTLVVRYADRVLRAVVRHWWVAVVGALAPIGLFVAILLLGRQTLVALPPAWTLVVGVVLLGASTAMALRIAEPADPVVGPTEAGGAGTMAEGAVSRGLQRLTPWLFPVLTAVMALPWLLIQR